jgi:hypothetical protein
MGASIHQITAKWKVSVNSGEFSAGRTGEGQLHTSMHFSPGARAMRLVCAEDGYTGPYAHTDRLSPTMYRETLAHILRTDCPSHEVRLADPQVLDWEAASFGPHLIVANDDAPEVREDVSVPSSWVMIRYHDHLSASVFVDGQDPRLVQDMSIEDLLGVVEKTQRLVVGGG